MLKELNQESRPNIENMLKELNQESRPNIKYIKHEARVVVYIYIIPVKLFKQVLWQKGEEGVLSGSNLVREKRVIWMFSILED